MTTISAASTPIGEDQHIRLACQACQRKKIKCDRSFPCGQCNRSTLHCVPSTRKPRARHAGKRAVDGELRNRITKLESLVESLSGEVGIEDDTTTAELSTPLEPTESTSSPTVGKYIGAAFWSSLTTEVQALRDALEEDQQEDEPEAISSTTANNGTNGQQANDYDFFMCPPGAVYIMPGALNEPTPQMQSILYRTFIANVAPMFKVFHIPTLCATIERGLPYLGHDANAPPVRLVKAVLWFAAVNTMTDSDCRTQFGQARSELLPHYRRVVDVSLAQADLMNTTDVATLQAFVITLIASRPTDPSRRAWTMTALLVRIARAMDLHHETPGRTPFETETRRRLWHTIRFLDAFTSLDRATEALIADGTYDTPRPSNVNDSEYNESSTSIPSHETGLTDMAFALLASEAAGVTQRLSRAEVRPSGDTWQQRLDLAQNFSNHVQEKYLQYCDPTIPFHRLIAAIAQSMSAGMILRAVRPMQRHVSSTPPRIDSPYVLRIAVDSLSANESIFEDPEAERWRWLVWVQWHALAVALAGLCSIRGTELTERAWPCIEKAYDRHSRHVADTRNGMLWRPVEKLYKKARAFREAGRRESQLLMGDLRISAETSDASVTVPKASYVQQTLPQQAQLNHHGLAAGSMPMNPMMNGAMDFSSTYDFNDTTAPLQPGDVGWLDWESIMDDFSDIPLDNTQQPHVAQNGEQWPDVLHSDMI